MKTRMHITVRTAAGDFATIGIDTESETMNEADLLKLCGAAGVGSTGFLNRRTGFEANVVHADSPQVVPDGKP